MTNCQHPADNHSGDTVAVFYGASSPLVLCGFHALQLGPAMFDQLRAHGVI